MMKKAKATTEITPLRNALERLFTFNDIGQLRFEAAAPPTIRLSRLYKQSATFSTTASILVKSAAVERLYASFGTHRHLARINCVCVRVCVSVTASLTIMLVLGKLRVLLLPHKRRLPSDRALHGNTRAAMRTVLPSTEFIFAFPRGRVWGWMCAMVRWK